MNDHLRLCPHLDPTGGEIVHKQAGLRRVTVCGIRYGAHVVLCVTDPVSCDYCRLGALLPDVELARPLEPALV